MAPLCITIPSSYCSRAVSIRNGTNSCLFYPSQDHRQAPVRVEEYRCRRSIPPERLPNVGLRYESGIPTRDLSGLSSKLQATIDDCYRDYIGKDRGSVRAANDRTLDSRADHFVDWLRGQEVDFQSLSRIEENQVIAIIGSYARQVNLGYGLTGKQNLVEGTLVGYMNAAASWWTKATGKPINICMPLHSGKKAKLVPFLADIVTQRTAWKKPRQKREPYTYEMFSSMFSYLNIRNRHDGTVFIQKDFAVINFSALGLHTGSRLGEYGQSKPMKGEPFATVPMSSDAGEWAGMPIAFIRADWEYYDANLIRHSYRACIKDPELAMFVHIRFRYDKSKNNFTIRKFKRFSDSILCPVKNSLAILQRADLLGIPENYPIGAFRPRGAAPGAYAFLNGSDVSEVMQRACRLAYRNEQHYLRLHIHLLHSHSNRITAAVALYNAGVPIPVIAYRLRWSPESVVFYIRDCFKAIGPLTEKAITGTYLN